MFHAKDIYYYIIIYNYIHNTYIVIESFKMNQQNLILFNFYKEY